MAGGVGPIATLQGKVNASNQLQVAGTLTAQAGDLAHLDGQVQYTNAVLIPAPLPTQRVVITNASASVLTSGVFRFTLTAGPRTFGPVWLSPAGGGVLGPRGVAWSSGPIVRRLPPGVGLAITTSAAVPQSFDVDYYLEDAE